MFKTYYNFVCFYICGCETCFLTLREQHGLRMYENETLRTFRDKRTTHFIIRLHPEIKMGEPVRHELQIYKICIDIVKNTAKKISYSA